MNRGKLNRNPKRQRGTDRSPASASSRPLPRVRFLADASGYHVAQCQSFKGLGGDGTTVFWCDGDGMRVLALNPFHGGSHRAFLEGWRQHSRHDFTLLTLPDRHWKWRMRNAAIAFADQLRAPQFRDVSFDVLFVTDMMNLAELRGLCASGIAALPGILYFHENQLTYPSRGSGEDRDRDLHFAVTNIVSALAADAVWFNSAFHRESFLTAVDELSRRLPDATLAHAAESIRARSSICPPGIEPFPPRAERPERTSVAPLHILWAARWEHDKQPGLFFSALDDLDRAGHEFQLSVVGQSYRDVPACFAKAREQFKRRIVRWGYLDDRQAYRDLLQQADLFVSTAEHEFFGIAAAEAIAAGCYPLLPDRLAYPELIGGRAEFLFPGDVGSLSDRMASLADTHQQSASLHRAAEPARQAVGRFQWQRVASTMDQHVEGIAAPAPAPNSARDVPPTGL